MSYGFVLPIEKRPVVLRIENSPLTAVSRPFFRFMPDDDERLTVKGFIDAVLRDCPEDAKVYVSKNYLDRVDIEMIREQVMYQARSPFVVNASYEPGPKNCRKNTLLIKDSDRIKLFHIYMLNEPDNYGKWKIYGIEQE